MPASASRRVRDGCGASACSAAARADLSSLRVALVHDWLTGMRGGEKCLEVLCRAFPHASLYTLIHRRGSTSPAIESMTIRTSPLQRVPGVFRHYRHSLAAHAAGGADVEAEKRGPGRQPEPLRGQVGQGPAWGAPCLLLLHTDALCLARARRLPGRLGGSADPPGACRWSARPPPRRGTVRPRGG